MQKNVTDQIKKIRQMRTFQILNLLIFVSLMILSDLIQAQTSTLDSLLQQIREKYTLVGMSVTMTKNDQIFYSQGYGQKDITRNLPVDHQTAYRIASISKMVTATALLQLYEKNLFDLDEEAGKYLGFDLKNPSYPEQTISIRQILSHTSSLRDGSGYNSFLNASYNNTPPPRLEELLAPGGNYYTADMFSSLNSPDAHYFQYANVNFGVAGTLLERISGQRFDLYCKEHIFDPLQIDGSFNVQHLSDINNLAVLYRKSGPTWIAQFDNYQGNYPPPRDLSGYTIGDNGIIFSPQGGLRISSQGLARIMLAHLNGGTYDGITILNDTTVARLHEIVWDYNGSNGNNYYGIFNTYALGNHTNEELLPGEKLTGHPGEAYGLISDMYFSREKDYGIIFITNGGLWGNGTYSGWYNVEEEVFQACFSELQNLSVLSAKEDYFPEQFLLYQNFPNPFNSETSIEYQLPVPCQVDLSIYNILGQKVTTVISQKQSAGYYRVVWDANELSSGVYIYKLSTEKSQKYFIQSRKLILLK